MLFLDTEGTLLLIGILLLTTVLAGTLSSRFGLPALIGFLGLGMLAGVPGVFAIFNIVFFVVLLSSLLQGPTIKWAAQVLHIADHDAREAYRAIV